MRLAELVKIDNRFEKSVNLLLDLEDVKKLDYYIPTHSSVNLLTRFIEEVKSFSGARANILIGPYGKGKSHLLLVMLSLLAGHKTEEGINLLERICKISRSEAESIGMAYGHYKFLPVIINTSSGNLSQAFVRSLNQALKRNKLHDVVPDNYFSEAVKAIQQWKMCFPETYTAFEKSLEGCSAETFIRRLENYDYTTLEIFRTLHPALTSGSEFNPIIDDEVISVYRSVNRLLCERYGYTGIYIVFDEFSKYIEGHSEEGFSTDMKILQDVCELCNSSKEEQIHLTCVAHKAIRAYGESLSQTVRNAFRGVEGRLVEMPFHISSQNNYELIADAIKKLPDFYKWNANEKFISLLDESYSLRSFNTLFTKDDFYKIVGNGCYPLTPLSAFLLLNLSERIAQNERTIFTFLAGKELNGLTSIVERQNTDGYVGAGNIYDYFVPLFEEDKTTNIHSTWLKTEYAIGKCDSEEKKDVVKTLAVIQMINNHDDIPANNNHLRLALGWDKQRLDNIIDALVSENIIVYKKNIRAYDFPNKIGINIENEISDLAMKYYSKIELHTVLNDVYRKKYILPKKYNQLFSMSRYYRILCMTSEAFSALSSLSYLHDNNEPDGYLLLLFDVKEQDREALIKHTGEINDSRLVVSFLESAYDVVEVARTLLSVRKLLENKEFADDNEILCTECRSIETEAISELNSWMDIKLETLSKVYHLGCEVSVDVKGINRTISNICENTYDKTPIINHELINRNRVSAQISKARNIIMEDYLLGRRLEKYETGTSAESTIFRATISHTHDDENLKRVKAEILSFIHESKGKKVPFSKLIDVLTSPPIGLRKGVIPLYIVEQLVELEDMPVVYLGRKELSIDAVLMSNIVAKPEDYSLYVEVETGEKLEYIEGLETLFEDYTTYCREIEKRNRLSKLTCIMQAWYRSLPQTSQVFADPDYDGQDMKIISAFRKILSGNVNPREALFDMLPKYFGKNNLIKTLEGVTSAKKQLDDHIHVIKKNAISSIRQEIGLNESDDLLLSIKSWYEAIPTNAKNSVLSMDSQRLMAMIRDLTVTDGEEIAEKFAKEITGLFIEDWNDRSIHVFKEGIHGFIEEVNTKALDNRTSGSRKISFAGDSGIQECFYEFDPDNMSVSGHFFQSALDDMLEEYGESVENNEKIGILMAMVKKLMG